MLRLGTGGFREYPATLARCGERRCWRVEARRGRDGSGAESFEPPMAACLRCSRQFGEVNELRSGVPRKRSEPGVY
jgi:hypothetical protein